MRVWSRESGVKSQESRVRSQESGVKSQELRVRSQALRVKSQESGVKSQESGVVWFLSMETRQTIMQGFDATALIPQECLLDKIGYQLKAG